MLNRYSINVIPCGNKNVIDGIGEKYKKWSSYYPVFISAQTGAGKNTFIKDILLPYLDSSGVEERILILSNRIALNAQIKAGFEESGYSKCVDVMTYHRFRDAIDSIKSQQKRYEKYTYVVFDEAHFFTSDAMFNPYTDEILDEIYKIFRGIIRIYMTATPYDCLWYICGVEQSIWHSSTDKERLSYESLAAGQGMAYYKFDRDYSYLEPVYYFSKHEQLKAIIQKSIDEGEKWLIFIDNKNQCAEFKKELVDNQRVKENDVLILNAGTKDKAQHKETIENEKFKQKILITTSVLDNGVNFRDPTLKNVVISDIDKAKSVQMVGRVRADKGEKINLYIQYFDEAYIREKVKELRRKERACESYYKAYYETRKGNIKRKSQFTRKSFIDQHGKNDLLFGRSRKNPELYRINKIAVILISDAIKKYASILSEIIKTGDSKKYLEYQLAWFGKSYDKDYDLTMIFNADAEAEFAEYVKTLPERVIDKAEQSDFKLEFQQKFYAAYGLRTKEAGYSSDDNKSDAHKKGYGTNKINDIFRVLKIGLKAETDYKDKKAKKDNIGWIFIEYDWAADTPKQS